MNNICVALDQAPPLNYCGQQTLQSKKLSVRKFTLDILHKIMLCDHTFHPYCCHFIWKVWSHNRIHVQNELQLAIDSHCDTECVYT